MDKKRQIFASQSLHDYRYIFPSCLSYSKIFNTDTGVPTSDTTHFLAATYNGDVFQSSAPNNQPIPDERLANNMYKDNALLRDSAIYEWKKANTALSLIKQTKEVIAACEKILQEKPHWWNRKKHAAAESRIENEKNYFQTAFNRPYTMVSTITDELNIEKSLIFNAVKDKITENRMLANYSTSALVEEACQTSNMCHTKLLRYLVNSDAKNPNFNREQTSSFFRNLPERIEINDDNKYIDQCARESLTSRISSINKCFIEEQKEEFIIQVPALQSYNPARPLSLAYAQAAIPQTNVPEESIFARFDQRNQEANLPDSPIEQPLTMFQRFCNFFK